MADLLYWTTPLIMGFDGANGSTTFTNDGALSPAFTAAGNASISTLASKFGGSSGLFDGTGDWVQTTDTAAFVLSAADFTLEFWLKTSDSNAALIDYGLVPSGGSSGWGALITSTGKLRFIADVTVYTGAVTVNDNAWHHLALVRASGMLKVFIDGIQDGADTSFATSLTIKQAYFAVGACVASRDATYDYSGYIDDLRLTKGGARYTANFTPPGALDLVRGVRSYRAVTPMAVPAKSVTGGNYVKAYKSMSKSVFARDMYFGGTGRIVGTVKEAGSPSDLAVVRRVRLYRKRDGVFVKETWSAADGSYAFNNIDATIQYYVLSFDHTGNYNGVIKDTITPEAMP